MTETTRYQEMADKLNNNYPNLKANVRICSFYNTPSIDVVTCDKAKIAKQMFPTFKFTSNGY